MPPPCLVTGSRIRTAHGDLAIEDIYAGDEIVVLRDGLETVETVVWVGHRNLDLTAQPRPEMLVPVRVRAHAVADGQPARDLLVSQDHCLFLDGKCVPARLLVNGGSIAFERHARAVTYHHIELGRHGIMLAENLPTETYLDTGNRDQFSNADGAVALRPTFALNAASDAWQTQACAPLAIAPEQVRPIWARLAERSAAFGLVPADLRTTADADIHLTADGQALRPVSRQEGTIGFAVPAGVRSVSLDSRYFIPVDIASPWLGDTRRLGLRVSEIHIRSDAGEMVLAADDPRLTTGWYDAESQDGATWRWTDGAAYLPMAGVSGAAVVTIRCKAADAYPLYEDALRRVA